MLWTIYTGVKSVDFSREGLSLEGTNIWQEAFRNSFRSANWAFPWIKVVQVLNGNRRLNPMDGLSMSNEIDVSVLLQEG